MPTRDDLDLAKRLLGARALTEEQVRQALQAQGEWVRQGKVVPLERALYALKILPPGSLAALTAPDPLKAQPFANYRLDSVLGEGGAGIVYGGTYVPNRTPVAVKVLDPIHALRADFVERFHAEAEMLAEIDHENIVAGYEHGTEGGRHFLSMDLVEGATVLEVIERRGRLTNREALSIALQVARALDHLHGRGLLHRDLKPGNIMVEASGRARLIDLGLVRRVTAEDADGPREEGTTVGTVEYLSPEQARGRADLDPRSDVYSLGLTLYHMVVGEVPFQGETDYEVMAKQVMASLDAQKLKHRFITPEIYAFIVKMTSKDREQRYRSAAAAAKEIEGYLPEGILPLDLGPPPAKVLPRVMPISSHSLRPTPPAPAAPREGPAGLPPAPTPRRGLRPRGSDPSRGGGPAGDDEPPRRRRLGR